MTDARGRRAGAAAAAMPDGSQGSRRQSRRPPAVGRWPALLAVLLTAAAMLASPAALGEAKAQRLLQISGAKRTVSIIVAVGKTEDVRVDAAFTDLAVGDPEVADITPLTDRTVSVLGRKIGTTRVAVYAEGKKQVGIFDIEVTYDVSRLAAEISRFGGGIKVSSINGRVMLSGTAPDAATLDKAVVIARQFAPDPINAVSVLQAQQVMLEVRFVEASRDASRELGVQWNGFGANNNPLVNIGNQLAADHLPVGPVSTSPLVTAGSAAGVLSGATPYGFLLGILNRGNLSIDVALNALEQKGLARRLAEPNLVALSGDTASFLAGGEYPIPIPGSLGSPPGIDYKKYGVGLAFTPTVLKDGLINLVIKPEVSQLDFTHPVQIASISVPALTVRRATTTVELRDGQSFVIGGLLQNDSTTAQDQLPWLGDVPVLGALFRSSQYQKHETDLAIIITPHIVRPISPGNPVKTPLDNTLPANDIDFFLMGKPEITPTDVRLALGQQQRFVGHILDLPKGDLPKGDVHVVAVKD
jgi:pilus assembly protein CpaC